jgi:glycosyltransferase involved in cell wall biosynthesis
LIKSIYNIPEIDEIIVSDDCSDDYKLLQPFKFPKLKYRTNETNLGAFLNKLEAVKASEQKYSAVLDSDNHFDRNYFKAFINAESWFPEGDVIFCPERIYRPYTSQILWEFEANTMIDFKKWKELPNDFKMLFGNVGNYIVPETFKNIDWDTKTNYKSFESLYTATKWLKEGNRMFIVPGMYYFHDTESTDGIYRKYAHESEDIKQLLLCYSI